MAAPKSATKTKPSPEAAQEQNRRTVLAAKRILKARKARESLVAFTELTMPHPTDPDNPDLSRYEAQYFHRALAAVLETVVAGETPRLIVTFPPRHGKSELTSRRLPAWFVGLDPYRHCILATYNQPFADDFGKDVRAIMQSDAYAQIFPEAKLRKGGAAADRLQTEAGGLLAFVGRGGSVTGRGGDLLIIDDPLKNRAEADSAATREELWKWFNDDLMSRLMDETGVVIIIQTRWHEDDLVGRLTDPENPHYNEDEARQWKIINIPAIAVEDDVLGRKPGEALWPGRFGIEYLESFRRRNPSGFASLYQQTPTPADGELFKAEHILTYQRQHLPKNLRIYGASDHAVALKQENDKTCMLIGGVDERDEIWLLDGFWGRVSTDEAVERWLDLVRRWKPVMWWAEKDHITRSVGPFLRRRMRETRTYFNLHELSGAADKVQKAQPIIARSAMGMVHFPAYAPWLASAKSELLKFPRGAHDDFVDALANFGRGLEMMTPAQRTSKPKDKASAIGTLGWVRQQADAERKAKQFSLSLAGM